MIKHFSCLFLCLLTFSITFSQDRSFNLIHFDDLFISSIDHCVDTDTNYLLNTNVRLFSVSSFYDEEYKYTYLYGLNFNRLYRERINFSGSFDYLDGEYNALLTSFKDSLNVLPGFGNNSTRLIYNFSYKINNFINMNIGQGKHFIGSGYRSLFLSHNSSAFPYLKLTTEFGRVKYYNLYTTFVDIQSTVNRKKHAAIHFLDFRLNKYINVGIFESVLWRAKDTSFHRGYDIEYLNPIIFYRPVEFAKNSPDNVLMGMLLHVTYLSNDIYAKLVLDDLNISRHKDRVGDNYSSGFFQNKFGYQLGVSKDIKDMFFLIEYNQVQPYTYAHKEPMQSYTHMNQALAHPLGANFKEIIGLIQYKKNNWKINLRCTAANVGMDSVDTHYGQNIFASDFDAQIEGAQYSYGNFNGQGVLTRINTFQLEYVYSFDVYDFFASFTYNKKESNLIDKSVMLYSLGLRTIPFTTFFDY